MAQHFQTLETIARMKVALKRVRGDGNAHLDNGPRLKRRSIHPFRLNENAVVTHKRKIEHAGYKRSTISTNPPLVDDDGDLYSLDSDEDETVRNVEPVDENPFQGIQLEQLLRPLTSAADLSSHPTLSLPYTSSALTQMADEALEMLRRERANLWQAKRLLQRFQGDGDWVPSANFETEHDDLLLNANANGEGSVTDQSFVPSMLEHPSLQLEATSGQLDQRSMADAAGDNLTKAILNDEHHGMPDDNVMDGVETTDMVKVQTEIGKNRGDSDGEGQREDLPNGGTKSMDDQDQSIIRTEDTVEQAPNALVTDVGEREAISETASNSNGTSTHGMTTRARARSPAEQSDRTPSPSPSDSASAFAVHPWFLAPTSCLSDRDLGLPVSEAEETRRLLLLYVQKQEQVVRSFDSLCTGLQKADRLRHYVFQSCKAEAHIVPDGKGNMVTEMSDGEDWYDLADWRLQARELKDGDLEKGKDEVEDVEEEGRRRPGRGRRVNRI